MEIERKWLITKETFNKLKDKCISYEHLQQGYLSVVPEVRIVKRLGIAGDRKGICDYNVTFKSTGGLCRTEIEKRINKSEFKDLAKIGNITYNDFIRKAYIRYKYGDHIIEASCVDDGVFYYAEIEFATKEEAESFYPPEFLTQEVTSNSYWKMKNYWERKIKL